MAKIRLTQEELDLLREVLEARDPEQLLLLRHVVVEVPDARLRHIQDLLGSELSETGFDSSDVPTAKGLAIEQLIDAMSPYADRADNS